MYPTSIWSMPSSPIGFVSRTSGTASAAVKTSGKPTIASARSGGFGIRFRVAPRTITQVASVPTRARATFTFVRRELVQILIAGDAARNLRINLLEMLAMLPPENLHLAIQLCTRAAARHHIAELSGPGRPNRHSQTVISE